MLLRILLLVIAFLCLISCDDSDDDSSAYWIYYASHQSGCNFYYDSNSIKQLSDNKIKVRRKITCPGEPEFKTVIKMYCTSGMSSQKYKPSQWPRAIAKSYSDPLFKLLCNK
jgi:hypothetical protein